MCEETVFQTALEFQGQPVLDMMPKFDLILLLLLAKSFAQENPGPLFKAVGKTLELGFCFGVDYLIAYKIYEGEKQLLWNSSDSASLPDAYKNRFHISSSSPGLLGFQLMDLDVSDSGEYLRECWLGGKPTNRHSYYLYICYEEMEPQELSSQNGSIVLDCDTSYSEREGASVTWFREVYPGYKTSLILDTARSEELLDGKLNSFLQVQHKGFSLCISEAGLEYNHNFYCLVMEKGQCKSFKYIQLADHKPDAHYIYYGVGEKAVFSCQSEDLKQQQLYWKTPLGNVNESSLQDNMYALKSQETRDYLLVIPSIEERHSGEYICLWKSKLVEYYITVCSNIMSDNVQLYSGGKINLPCLLTKNESHNILWYRQIGMETELIYDSEDPSIDIPHDMISRTQILDSNGSLILTELDEKDSGKYWCVVLLDSVEEEADDSEDYEDEEQDSVEPIDYWVSDEENGEKCIIKRVTNLNIQSNQSRIETTKSDSETSPVTYAVIGCVFGIVILGLIIFVVVAKMRAKRKASDSNRTQSTAQQKENRTASAPLMVAVDTNPIQAKKACRHGQDDLLQFKPSVRMGNKGDLSDFERGMVVGARQAGLSISETADLLGFSCTTISRVYREWSEKEKISSERQFCGRKCLVDARGQRRMARLVRAGRKATVTQITTHSTKVCRRASLKAQHVGP
ncbi:hypothetical protein C0J45_11826 [Silurus meridionalis]|nr:hypothetical protein C0J45_11826 [Silurus meridionalis]